MYDFMSFLDSIQGPQQAASEILSQEYAAQRAEYQSVGEATTSASFKMITPICFAGSAKEKSDSSCCGSVAHTMGAGREFLV
mmetsp:Transcript_13543/g.19657  ORF Transcript_13543/g.19657 Transcript_13543/m.19657 type:complete len:82 (+) Transcript_13543:1524-1769(+)